MDQEHSPGRGSSLLLWPCSAICWEIWKCRNRACFDKKVIKNPAEIVVHVCALMSYWAGLLPGAAVGWGQGVCAQGAYPADREDEDDE